MMWIGIGVTLVAAIALLVTILTRRSADDLGSVSVHWITEHRAEQ